MQCTAHMYVYERAQRYEEEESCVCAKDGSPKHSNVHKTFWFYTPNLQAIVIRTFKVGIKLETSLKLLLLTTCA